MDTKQLSPDRVIRVAINRSHVFPPKFEKGDERWGKFNGEFETVECTINELLYDVIKKGYSFTVELSASWKDSKHFVAAYHAGLDFDHSSIERLMFNTFVQQYGGFAYNTCSHTPKDPRSRLIFFLETPITDLTRYQALNVALLKLFPEADEQIGSDVVRTWLGCKDCNHHLIGKILTDEMVEQLVATVETKQEPIVAPLNGEVIHREEKWIAHYAAQCSDGRRNVPRYKFACQLRDDGVSLADAKTWIPKWLEASGAGRENGAEAEMASVVESVYQRTPRTPAPETTIITLGKKNGHKKQEKKTSYTGSELMKAQFPPARWLVKGVISAGMTFLAGRPKSGKSILATQLSIAVSDGGKFLDFPVEKGAVLYVDFEMGPISFQTRLQKMGFNGNDNITFEFDWPTANEGGLDELRVVAESGKYSLIVIDTLARFAKGMDHISIEETTELCGAIQQTAVSCNVPILVVDHHGKPKGGDNSPIDDVIGSTSKSAVADVVIGLYRDQKARANGTAELRVQGRNVEDSEYALMWNRDRLLWHLVGDAEEVRVRTLKDDILDLMQRLEDMGEAATCTTIAKYLEKQPANIHPILKELKDARKIRVATQKIGREVRYMLVDDADGEDPTDKFDSEEE